MASGGSTYAEVRSPASFWRGPTLPWLCQQKVMGQCGTLSDHAQVP